MQKQYDRAYFDKWYRDREHAVNDDDEVTRKIALAVALAEYYLGREIATVLDIGCGEAHWRQPLLALRPQAFYQGLDASPYVVQAFGATRNIMQARFADLAYLRFAQPFDLILCSNLLHYLDDAEIIAGLEGMDELLQGLALIEIYTGEDDLDGDTVDFHPRHAAWYRQALTAAGLQSVGSHCYVGSAIGPSLLALEQPA